jgi:thiamine biosynthesis lipoprotein
MHARWQALGSSAVLKVTDPAVLQDARAIVEAGLAAVDRACSRFRPDSDLSRVNACVGQMVAVDSLLIEALDVALRGTRLTDGDVDPALGGALVLAGYDRDWQLMTAADSPDAKPHRQARHGLVHVHVRRGWKTIEIDRAASAVCVPRGIQLDLGATAKAWAADRAAAAVHQATGAGVLVCLGGDIATAGAAPANGWRVHVSEDHRAGVDAPGQTVSIASGGLATSSTTVRRWRQGSDYRHHIIDPYTGTPTEGPWRTVSVAAGSCTDANIASTAALVRGCEAADWLSELGLPARLVGVAGEVKLLAGWPSEPTGEQVAA